MTKMKNRGFTLVEVMVAAAIAGGLALVIGTLTKQSTQTSAKLQSDIDATTITNEIMAYLADPKVCGQAGAGTQINLWNKSIVGLPGTVPNILNFITKRDGSVIYKRTTEPGGPFYYGTSQLEIASYSIDDPVAGDSDDVNSQTVNNRTMFLTIRFNKKNVNKTAASTQFVRRIKISFQTNAADTGTTVVFCKAVSTGYDGVWQRGAGANINDIYYGGGNVGIGTASPTQQLSLEGGDLLLNSTVVDGSNIRLKNSAANTWLMDAIDATNSRFRLFTEGGASGSQERLTALENGRIGIGTAAPNTRLEVSDAAGARIRAGGALNAGFELNDVNTRIDIPAANTMALYTSNLERLRISSAGNVGIGINNPTVPLHVNGNAIMGARLETGLGVAGGTSEIELGQHRTGNGISYLDFHSSPGSDYDFRILRNSGVNGNVDFVNAGTGNINIASTSGRVVLNYAGMNTSGLNDIAGGAYDNDAATKLWVRKQIATTLGTTDPNILNTLAATIANYASTNTMAVIHGAVCSALRTRVGGIDYSYTWNGVTCTSNNILVPPDCTIPGNCTNLYATNMNATTMTATNICAGGACNTRFGRAMCPDGFYMYGISKGLPLCTSTRLRNMNGDGAAPWTTTTGTWY